MSKWQRIFRTEKYHLADLVVSVLEEKGFHPVLVNKKDSAYQIGMYEVYVAPESVLKAIKVISDEIRFE